MPRRSVAAGQKITWLPTRVRQATVFQSDIAVAGQLTAVALEAVTGDKFTFDILEPITVVEFRLQVTVAMDYNTLTAAAVVALDRRITFNSDTGRVELGRITIPNAAPAGEQIYKAITPTNLERGDQLVVEVVTAGTGGGAIAGDWRPVIIFESIDHEDATIKTSDAGLTASV